MIIRQRTLICWFSLNCPPAKNETLQTWSREFNPGSPCGWQWRKYLCHHLQLHKVCMIEKLELWVGLVLEPRHSAKGWRNPKRHLNTYAIHLPPPPGNVFVNSVFVNMSLGNFSFTQKYMYTSVRLSYREQVESSRKWEHKLNHMDQFRQGPEIWTSSWANVGADHSV